MRTFAFIGAVAVAALTAASSSAWAWSSEAPVQQGPNAVDLTDNDNFKALQDKVNGKISSPSSDSGFHFSGSVNSGETGLGSGNPYGLQPMPGRSGSAFSYSPMPGFRGQGD